MKTYKINSFKVANILPLNKINTFFQIKISKKHLQYLILDENLIQQILKYDITNKKAYIFEFGCISFVNFEKDEVFTFLNFLNSITQNINYSLMAIYYDSHNIEINENNEFCMEQNNTTIFKFNNNILDIVSVTLAKSIELSQIETDLNKVLDNTEFFIIRLQTGKYDIKYRKMASVISEILRFEYYAVNIVQLLDKDLTLLTLDDFYSNLFEYYNIKERFNIILSKLTTLRNLTKNYIKLNHKRSEHNLYNLQVFLLALFPISYFINKEWILNVLDYLKRLF